MSELPKSGKTRLGGTGFSAKSIIIPAVILIFCLHLTIIFNTLKINRLGETISRTTQFSFMFSQMTWGYEDSTEKLSDQARMYVSSGNPDHLAEYIAHRGALEGQASALNRTLAENPVSHAPAEFAQVMEMAQERTAMELHAMRLRADAVQLDMDAFPQLEEVTLSAAERALAPEEKINAAALLLVSDEYMQTKYRIHDRISRSVQTVSDETSTSIREQSAILGRYRALQWVMTLTIITILFLMCVLLFALLLNPLEKSVALVQSGTPLPTDQGLSEFRRLAYSYNELLHHRKMMESYLRKQSQTDALTKLANRLAFQDYVSRLSWEKAHSSVTVFSLDVNGLKEANDRRGHAFGDTLLCESAACIMDAFGGGEGKRCFRFGGDEFAAFWVDVPTEEIDRALARFNEDQDTRGLSISVGFAHTEDLSETTVEALFDEADQIMYQAKEQFHKETDASKTK